MLYDVDCSILLQYNAVEQVEADSPEEATKKVLQMGTSDLFHLAHHTGVGIKAKVNVISVEELK